MAVRPAGVSVSLTQLMALRSRANALTTLLLRRHANVTAGPRQSRAHGRGMEYAESRVYTAGDDVRHMDWRVTARTGEAHTKVFHADRGRDLIVVVDLSTTMHFGTRAAFKSVVAAHLSALAAWAANSAGDRIGAIVMTDGDTLELRPATGERTVLGFLNALCSRVNAPRGVEDGDVAPAYLEPWPTGFETLCSAGATLLVVSDFYRLDSKLEATLERVSRRCHVLLAQVFDPLEAMAPPAGRYTLTDGRAQSVLDVRTAAARRHYEMPFAARTRRLETLARRLALSYRRIRTDDDPVTALNTPPRAGGADINARQSAVRQVP